MKTLIKIIFVFAFLTFNNKTEAQIHNTGFEDNQGDKDKHCPDNSGDISSKPFNTGKVSYWNASHGSPQLYCKTKGSNAGSCLNNFDAQEGDWCAFLSYDE